MDTMLVVQLSFYLFLFVLVFVIIFAIFKSLLLLVFARKPKRPPSTKFEPHRTPLDDHGTMKPQEEPSSLPASPPAFKGRPEQLPNVLCRVTGNPIINCDCAHCSKIHGKVRN